MKVVEKRSWTLFSLYCCFRTDTCPTWALCEFLYYSLSTYIFSVMKNPFDQNMFKVNSEDIKTMCTIFD